MTTEEIRALVVRRDWLREWKGQTEKAAEAEREKNGVGGVLYGDLRHQSELLSDLIGLVGAQIGRGLVEDHLRLIGTMERIEAFKCRREPCDFKTAIKVDGELYGKDE